MANDMAELDQRRAKANATDAKEHVASGKVREERQNEVEA